MADPTPVERIRAYVERLREGHRFFDTGSRHDGCRCGQEWPCPTLAGWEAAFVLAEALDYECKTGFTATDLGPTGRLQEALARAAEGVPR